MYAYLIILHTARSVNKNNIEVIVPAYDTDQYSLSSRWLTTITIGDSFLSNPGSILTVTALV